MDFLDPKKQRRHNIILLVGYVLIGIAVLFGTTVLLYQSYGFGVGKNGQVTQSGLLFFSSQPSPAHIYLNNKLNKAQTNSRVTVPAGQYSVKLTRQGYRDWQRQISVQGGDVQHFDYPFLFPTTLKTNKITSYTATPGLATQSPDQRWLLVQQTNSFSTFNLYDLKNSQQAPTIISLPANLLSKATTSQSWQIVTWANDNQHILVQHTYDGNSEFILIDRQNPDQSINLNRTLSVNPSSVSLINKKYDQYYLYFSGNQELDTASLKSPNPTKYLEHILAYKSYGDTTMLYATDNNAPAGKVDINILDGTSTYLLRQVPAGTTYLLDMATYSGTLFVVAGAASENQVYIYKDPVSQSTNHNQTMATAIRTIRMPNPTYVAFSPNAQFIITEAGTHFGIFDTEYDRTYSYTTNLPLDAPQIHASWMDGDRLTYVGNGNLVVFDYDDANQQTLMPANSAFLPFFTPDYHYVANVSPATANGEVELNRTALLTDGDL